MGFRYPFKLAHLILAPSLSCLFLTGCITNGPATPQVNWATPAPINYGVPLTITQLNASTRVQVTLVDTPALGTVLAPGSQTLSVTFTPADTKQYNASSASVTLAVNQIAPVVSWSTPAPVTYGTALSSTQLNATTIVSGTFTDSPPAGAIPFTGSTYTSANVIIPVSVAPFGMAAWGDSLTFGNQGIDKGDYPQQLQPLIILPVVNEGVSGQTSTQIGVREGGVPTYATVAGGVIPASGGVTVTFPKGYEPVTLEGPAGGTPGSILGVHGLVTLDAGAYTFTPSAPGSAVNAPGSPRFVVDTPYAAYLPVFWEGRNNYLYTKQIKSDLAEQVATVPAGQNYLIMGIINVDLRNEWKGGISYNIIVNFNQELAAIYGSHYLDIRKVLVDSYNPALVTDVSDYEHDEVPTSLHDISFEGATLGDSVGPTDTTITVNTAELIPYDAGATLLTVDTGANAENVLVLGIQGYTPTGAILTVERNFAGNDTFHAAGVPVVGRDSTHLNHDGEQVVANAVAHYLSEYRVPQPEP